MGNTVQKINTAGWNCFVFLVFLNSEVIGHQDPSQPLGAKGGVIENNLKAAWRADDYLETSDTPMEIRMKESENILSQQTSQ